MNGYFTGLLMFISLILSISPTHANSEVNIYSFRQAFLVKPLLDAFTEQTGIKVNIVFSKKGLLERIKHEGRNSPADVLLTSDIGPLYDANKKGLLQPINSSILEQNIPAKFRSKDDYWYGLTSRARIIYASKDRVKLGEISSYEDLTKPKWQGRICTRSGKHTYNLSLFASMIAHKGEVEAKQWLAGLKQNLARRPQGNDRTQVKAIKEGVCDLALGNSYYFGKMITNEQEPEQKGWAKSVNLVFPNQADRGTHMNISGAALLKHAPHKEAAIKLIEFLSSDKAQKVYAETNFEFPVKAGVPQSKLIKTYMGAFKEDRISLEKIAELRSSSSKMVNSVRFDN